MGLTKVGNNTLTLTAANTFYGPTTVGGGTLDLDNSNALQNSTLTTDSIAFDPSVSSHTFSFGGLSGTGNLTLQTGGTAVALTVGSNNTSTIYAGNLSGSGSLTKVGTGALTFTGANNYGGLTTVSSGTLAAAIPGSLSHSGTVSNSVSVGGSGTLRRVSAARDGTGAMSAPSFRPMATASSLDRRLSWTRPMGISPMAALAAIWV